MAHTEIKKSWLRVLDKRGVKISGAQLVRHDCAFQPLMAEVRLEQVQKLKKQRQYKLENKNKKQEG